MTTPAQPAATRPDAAPSTPQQHLIRIPSRVAEVAGVWQQIVASARTMGFDHDAAFAIRLALDEAVTNAVKHGNGADPSKTVTIRYTLTPRRLEVTVCDEGPGFNPDTLPDPTSDERLSEPNGRGVMLMRVYMSEVHFNPRGNCVTLVRER